MAQLCVFMVGCAKIQCLCATKGLLRFTNNRVGEHFNSFLLGSATYQNYSNNNYVGIAKSSLSSL